MRILVMHQNFPGQYGHLVRAWSGRPGWEVRGLGQSHAPGLPGFSQLMRYRPTRVARPDQHPYLRPMENAVLNGQAAARAMLRMQPTGFRPDVIVGHPGWGETLYAKDPKSAQSWREYMLQEVQVDPARTHFFGRISRANYVRVLQVSAAHVYLTYPFVLSWSLLEAMACGAPIVASDTAPVREVIHGKRGGRLPGFFDTEGIADAVMECLENPNEARLQGASGQSRVQAYSLNARVQGYDRLVLPN
jgi:hypothetical protein